jgi:lipopolysaccharide assembly protein A
MKIFYLIAFFLIFVVALLFSLLNWHPVDIYFYKEFNISVPLVLALTLELLVGIVIGLSVRAMRIMKLKSAHEKLQQKLIQAEEEIRSLRASKGNQT